MLRSLLFLMVVTAQLLPGGGGSIYLCIANDGSYCCLDAGPATCRCCPHGIGDSKPAGKNESASHGYAAASEMCCHRHDGAEEAGYEVSLTSDPCGCTHLLISARHTTPVARPRTTSQTDQLSRPAVLMPGWAACHLMVAGSRRERWDHPPWARGLALSTLSTVVLRC